MDQLDDGGPGGRRWTRTMMVNQEDGSGPGGRRWTEGLQWARKTAVDQDLFAAVNQF